jgi:hypothetical protein
MAQYRHTYFDGSLGAMPEALDQLDELLAKLGSRTETK